MAGDQQGTLGDGRKIKVTTKLYMFDPNPLTYEYGRFMVGFAGTTNDKIVVSDFFMFPEKFDGPPALSAPDEFQGLVLTEKKEIFYFYHPAHWVRVNQPWFAIGSGAAAAMGALHMGATPLEAVKAASKVDSFTGMGFKTLDFS